MALKGSHSIMAKQPTSFRLPDLTISQLNTLIERTGLTQSEIVQTAIDRMYREETRTMKQIKVGTTNDLHLYAVEIDGQYFPLSESDLAFEKPDAKIYYDSGIYPGITDLPQYICDKARTK